MFTPTVQIMIDKGEALKGHHSSNLCSQCSNAVWMTTKHSTYLNAGTVQDHLKFLMSDAEDKNNAYGLFRCYCKILHEYLDFTWYDDGERLHIIDGCDSFMEYAEKETEKDQNILPKRMDHKTNAGHRQSMEI